MANKNYNYSLLQGFVKAFHLPWLWAIAIIAVIFLLFLLLVAYAQGYFASGIDWSFWRLLLQPAIVVYIFLIFPVTQRLWDRAMESLRVIVTQPQVINKIDKYSHRGEWMAFLAGAVFTVGMVQPWELVVNWVDLYGFISGVIMFGLLGLIIYGGIVRTVDLFRLSRNHLKLDVFDNTSLVPISRWSLSISLAFVGGISLSVLFQPFENLQNVKSIIVYAILISVTVLLFFISIWSIHEAMASAKKRELVMVRNNLSKSRHELKQYSAEGSTEGIDRLYSATAVWGLYERQVLEASTWPFNAQVIKRLVASAMTPVLVYGIKILAGTWLRI